MKRFLSILFTLMLGACAPKPYTGGPVFKQRKVQEIYIPVVRVLNIRPGATFADVGAGSGVSTVMMSTLMDSVRIYVQDIDTATLNQANLDKVISYYSQQIGEDLKKRNEYHLTIGGLVSTGLPDQAFDVVHTNATAHVFSDRSRMLSDLRRILKPTGLLYVRDSFWSEKEQVCTDRSCAKPLLKISSFLSEMEDAGFKFVGESPPIGAYPFYTFARVD